MHSQDPSIYFILIAGGPFETLAKQMIQNKNLSERVILTGFLNKDETRRWLKQLDLAHIYLSPRPANYARVSLKLCEYLALGIPVLGQCLGESKTQFGEWIMDVSLENSAQASLDFLNNPTKHTKHLTFTWPKTSESVAKLAQHLKTTYSKQHA